jgi:hypothetical protein
VGGLRWTGGLTRRLCSVHLEVQSKTGDPLPVSETGCKSHFLPRKAVEDFGGPVKNVTAWLVHEARTPVWQKYAEQQNQLTLS